MSAKEMFLRFAETRAYEWVFGFVTLIVFGGLFVVLPAYYLGWSHVLAFYVGAVVSVLALQFVRIVERMGG